MKHIAIPQSLLNEKARLDLADITGMDEATLAQHNADRLANDTALSLVGDQPMTAQEIADRQVEEAANIIAEVSANLKQAALTSLNTTVRMTAERCVIAGVPFPADWQAYVAALRAVVNGTSTNLPVQPLFPAGT